ncbi:MGMT family protein [Candidatus Pacearchaeota archaeon]|nr:MGMT family protein [Candidatus Pacearchaeota archaeon]
MTKNEITPFQKKVYKEVSKIPRSQTRSYKQIANTLKTSPRAVGQALKKNPFYFGSLYPKNSLVPCHRVIKSDGLIGGFKGKTSLKSKEVQRKIKLLREEGVEI